MQAETVGELRQICDSLVRITGKIREETRNVIAERDHVSLIKHFNLTRLAVESIKESREALHEISDNLSKQTIPETFVDLRERTGQKPPFVIEGVGRVTVSYRFSASMLEKEAAINWLKGNDYGSIVQETVNSSTLSAFAKELLEDHGKELPAELFKVGTSPYTSITKVK